MVNSHSPAFIANILNIVLATGIFTLPFSLWETGFYLGGIILLLVSLISFTTNSFIIETLAIANAIEKKQKLMFNESISKLCDNKECYNSKERLTIFIDKGIIEPIISYDSYTDNNNINNNNNVSKDILSLKSRCNISNKSNNIESRDNIIKSENSERINFSYNTKYRIYYYKTIY